MPKLLTEVLQTQPGYKFDMQRCTEMIPTDWSVEIVDARILDANIQCIKDGFVITDGQSIVNWGIDPQDGEKLVLIDTGMVFNLEEIFKESTPNNGDENDGQIMKK